MADKYEFISAADLPATETREVDVLCVDNGELKRKAGATLGGAGVTNVYPGDWCDDYSGSGYSGYCCYKDAELTELMSYAEFKKYTTNGVVALSHTETLDDGSNWTWNTIFDNGCYSDDYKVVYFGNWDAYLFFIDTELPAAVSTLSLNDEMETPATWMHTPYPPRG